MCTAVTRYRWGALAALLLGALPGVGSAQRSAPLLKTDLIQLLSSPVIPRQEIAALVRRNCLAFRPTERDLADLRSLGASAEVTASVARCATGQPARLTESGRPPAAAVPSAPATLQVVVRQQRIVVAAGGQERVVVLVARGGIPQAGVPIVLQGSAGIESSSGRDVSVVSDDSGFAVFSLKVGRRLATYRLEVAPAAGETLLGRPMVELVVRPGPPASAYVEPREVVFDHGLDSVVAVAVAVRDSIGYPVVGERVALGGSEAAMGFQPDTAVTDSLGQARLFVRWGGVREGGTLQVTIRGRQMAWLNVVVGTPLLEGRTGFLPTPTLSGVVGDALGAPVVFEARTRLGGPAVGRAVAFRAENATVSPTTAATDAQGRARAEITLGERAGPAIVVATIDSLERKLTLQVEPGPPVEFVMEHNGARVDGRWLVVGLETTFVVRVRTRDAYGNTTGVASLARTLRETLPASAFQVVRLLSVQEEPSAVALTFRAISPGRATVRLRTARFKAFVGMDVARLQ
jgi:hypothetical protein